MGVYWLNQQLVGVCAGVSGSYWWSSWRRWKRNGIKYYGTSRTLVASGLRPELCSWPVMVRVALAPHPLLLVTVVVAVCAAIPHAVMAIDLSRLYGHLSSKRNGESTICLRPPRPCTFSLSPITLAHFAESIHKILHASCTFHYYATINT